MNTVVLSQSKVCEYVSDLLCADCDYVNAVMDSGRIDYELRYLHWKDTLLYSIIQNGIVRMSDIVDERVLAIFAHALFFPTEDEKDTELLKMHNTFVKRIVYKFGNTTDYGEEIKKRCTMKDHNGNVVAHYQKDILLYLRSKLQALQEYIDNM